jgi:hypothetical protein
MTARTAFVSGLLLVATAWPLPSDAQRARVPSADAQETNRTAVPRATDDGPAPAPAPATAVPPPATETTGRTARERPPAPVVVSPTVSAPTNVGGTFSVGSPVVVGREFTVGGSREDRDRGDDRERRRHRRDDDDETVLVPVYVPVIVSESDVTTTPTYLEPDATAASATRAAARSSFLPWFQVGSGLMAGVPSALPAPDTFDEHNVSASVSETLTGIERTSSAYAPGTGGVSFDLVPADAAVFVDGAFVGSAEDFAPGREPLLLRFGAYAFELRARGYRAEAFRLDVRMGEVLPIAGALEKMPQ